MFANSLCADRMVLQHRHGLGQGARSGSEGALEEWPGRVDSEVQKRIFETMLTKAQVQRQALELPPEERIDLVVEIWDSLTAKDIPVPEWQRDLIRERLTELEGADPEDRATPWNKVLERVFPRKA